MKNARLAVVLFLISVFIAGVSFAATSTVNPNIPAQNSPLSSSVLRSQFLSTANDINAIYSDLTVGANQILGNTVAGIVVPMTLPNCSTLGYTNGTGFVCNGSSTGITATIGDMVCSGSPTATCALQGTTTARNDLGLGTAATVNTGTSGATLGLLNGNLVLSGTDQFTSAPSINLNGTALSAAQTGTLLQLGQANTTDGRIEVDTYGGVARFTGVRKDGTAAAPTALLSGDEIFSLNSYGYNGSAVIGSQASIRAFADQNWSVGANGTYIDIAVTHDNSSTLTSVVKFNNDGGIATANAIDGDQGADTISAKSLFATESGPGYALHATATGTGNTGYAGYFANTSTAGYAIFANGTAYFNGNAVAAQSSPALSTSTFTPNFSSGNHFDFVLVHASCPCTIAAPTNITAGQSGIIEIDQSSTGSDTVSWNSVYKFAGAAAPTLSTSANASDFFGYYVKDSSHIIVGSGVLNAH